MSFKLLPRRQQSILSSNLHRAGVCFGFPWLHIMTVFKSDSKAILRSNIFFRSIMQLQQKTSSFLASVIKNGAK